MTTIYFDMDGTIADLYGVKDWLDYLIHKDATPYRIAKPLINTVILNYWFNRLQKKGYRVGIISWLAKNSNEKFDKEITEAKRMWLKTYFPSVQFDEIHIVPYGYSKTNFVNDSSDILFDDEIQNREAWEGKAYDVDCIIEILKTLL